MPPLSFLMRCFACDFATGELVWRRRPADQFERAQDAAAWNAKFAGTVAGGKSTAGYGSVALRYEGRDYRIYTHRLVFFLATGLEPDDVDHIDRDKRANRLSNLRPATRQENRRNSRARHAGVPKGVHYDVRRQRYCAQAVVGGKTKNLGRYATADEAHRAYCEFVEPVYGEFFRAA